MNGVAVSSAQQPAAGQGQGTQVVSQVAVDPKPTADNAVVFVGASGGAAGGLGLGSNLSVDDAKVTASVGADSTGGTQGTRVQ